jgi:hypothetical protein
MSGRHSRGRSRKHECLVVISEQYLTESALFLEGRSTWLKIETTGELSKIFGVG